MIDYLLIAVTIALVIGLTQRFKLIAHCQMAMTLTTQANTILLDKSLSDLEKETQTQQMAKKLMTQFVRVMLAGVGAFLLPLLPLYALSFFNIINLDQLFTTMMSVEVLVIFVVVGLLSWRFTSRG